MKKFTKILFTTIILLSAICTLSCNLVDSITAPKNRWVEFELEYNKTTNSKVRCYAYYTEVQTTIEVFSDKEKLTVDPGLIIFARPVATTTNDDSLFGTAVSGAIEKQFVYKSFKNGEKIAMNQDAEEEESDKGFKLGYSTWLILYNSIKPTNKSSSVPESIRDGSKINTENFKWKKLMYLMAIDKLTELAAE